MHVRELVELGARLAIFGPELIRHPAWKGSALVGGYWSASKCRLDRWTRALKAHADQIALGERASQASWQRMVPWLEEVLAGEVLTRIFTPLVAARDQLRGEAELEPVARGILTGHLEARSRVLKAIVVGERLEVSEAKRLNDLRRKLERWTDMLLAHLAPVVDVSLYAFEPTRVGEFIADLRDQITPPDPDFTSKIVLASLHGSLQHHLIAPSPSGDLNARIAGSLYTCSGLQPLHSFGDDQPRWLERIAQTADEAQEMIDEMLAIDVG